MFDAKNHVWVKFFSFAIVLTFVTSGALMTVGSEPQTWDSVQSTVQSVPPYVPGTEWVKDGVVLDIGPTGEEKHVTTPCVLSMPDGTYAMWYQALGNDGHQRIMKAVSDDGLSWTRIGIALNYGEQYAESGVMFPFVMVDDSGMYHMWYSGYNYKWRAILHATSADGTTWTKLGAELLYGDSFDLDGVASPRVHFDGAQWHMWYSGGLWYPDRGTICHAHKASLSDPWIKDGTVLSNDGEYDNPVAWSPFILPTETGYDMFYGGRSPAQYPGRICHAYSEDGLSWTKTGIAVDRTLPGESYMTDYPSVIYEKGEYRMWYVGYDGINSRIYHASAASSQASSVDLSVASEDVSLSSTAPVAGETVTVTANVQGDKSSADGWVKHGVILDADVPGEDLRVAGPCVLNMPNGTYVMYYHAKANDGASTSLYWRIYRAFSCDGINWERQGMVLNYGGLYAGNAVYNPNVWIAPDGTYHMWYTGQNPEAGNRARILHATSPDGFNFVYDRLELNYGTSIEPAGVGYPFVMCENGSFRMWYTGVAWTPLRNWINHAHKANLADAWIRDGTVVPNTGQYDNPIANQPWVLATDSGYQMYYSGCDSAGVYRILGATSPDGYAWTKEGIVLESSLPEESAGVMASSVIEEGDMHRMWYTGWDGTKMRILYAEKAPGHTAQDATCTVSFYLDSQDPTNLIGSVENVLVPGDGQTPVSIDWTAIEGEHEIIVVVSDVNPSDSDLTNNIASLPVSVEGGTQVDLSVDDPTLSDSEPIAGTPVTITAVVNGDQSASPEWAKQGVVLDLGGPRENLHVYAPTVMKQTDGTYVMWYSGDDPDYCGQQIFRAVSDDGTEWSKTGMVLDYGGAYQEYAVQAPFVMLDDQGVYQMWYNGIGYSGGYRAYIHRATSLDGITWQKMGLDMTYGTAADPSGVTYPCVSYDGSQWHMWYTGIAWGSPIQTWISHARKASLSDPWIKDGIVLANDGAYDNPVSGGPRVYSTDSGYEMYYHGYDSSLYRILHATSADGMTWERQGIVIDPSIPTDGAGVAIPSVIREDGVCQMWYGGTDGLNTRIHYAEKVPGHTALDATCTVSFYLDTQDPANLIGSVENVFVPGDSEAQASIDWTAVEGEHEIIVVVSDAVPADSDLSNNVASAFISVCSPAGAALEVTKVRLSGPEEGVTHTYYEWELLITVTNTGNSDAADVMVMDVLPAELELLLFGASVGNVSTEHPGTRSSLPAPETFPIRSTHIYWTVGDLEAGQSETLYLKVSTRQNPAGKQEFTSPGTYIINEGAYATGIESLTGELLTSAPAPAITVLITEQEPVIGLPPQPRPISWNTAYAIAKPVNRNS